MKIKICEQWSLDAQTKALINKGVSTQLDHKQFLLLSLFLSHPQQVISKQQIFDHIWPNRIVGDDAIYVLINGLRKILGDTIKQPSYIKTISGSGYMWLTSPQIQTGFRLPVKAIVAVILSLILVFMGTFYFMNDKNRGIGIDELNRETKQQFIKARYLYNRDHINNQEATAILTSIINQYPHFIEANEILAKIYFDRSLANVFQEPISLNMLNNKLATLLRLEPKNNIAHLLSARLEFLLHKNYPQAEQHFKVALGIPESHLHYGQFLLALRQFKSALEQTYRYQTLEPEGYSTENVAWIYLMSGENQQAFDELEKLKRYSNNSFYYHVCRQALFEVQGDEQSAFSELLWLMKQTGYESTDLKAISSAFTHHGLQGAYQWLLSEDTKQLDLGQYQPPISLARYAVSAGKPEQAIALLKQSIEQGQIASLWIAADPKYQSLYVHPEFKALLEDINLNNIIQ